MTTPTQSPNPAGLHTILVGIDESPDSVYAIELAATIGAAFAATLWIVHVRPHPAVLAVSTIATASYQSTEREIDQLLQAELDQRLDHYPGPWALIGCDGDPPNQILALADTHNADLIVVGHHRHGTIGDAILGSVASAVVHRSHRPVLVAVTPTH